MTDRASTTRKAPVGGFIKRQRRREWLLMGLVAALVLSLTGVSTAFVLDTTRQVEQQEGVQRSRSEMVAGGKRFIDAFYSLNAATIKHDQFAAIKMMATEALKQRRLKYLTRTDLVRKVRDAGTHSEIRWDRASTEVLSQKGDVLRVEYKSQLVIDQDESHPLNIVLKLTPVPKTDDNTNGVGVLSWTDVAEDPFIEDEKGDNG